MGREGEVVARAAAGTSSGEHPGIRVRIEQLPWTAAHEKLLTAFAGDATARPRPAGQHLAAGVRGARRARAAGRAHRCRAATLPAADYFGGIWDTNVIDGRVYGVPWYVDTRLLFYRRDLLAAAGFAAVPTRWDELAAQRCRRSSAHVGRDRFAMLPAAQRVRAAGRARAAAAGEPLLRDGGRYGNFRGAGFRRALALLPARCSSSSSRRRRPTARSPTSGTSSARGHFAFYISGPWHIGEFRRRLPPALQNAWTTAPLPGPDGPGVSIAGGSSLAMFARSRTRTRRGRWSSYLSRPEVQQRFYELTGNLPPRRSAWDERDAGDERAAPAPSASSSSACGRCRKVPEWERIATEIASRRPSASCAAMLDDGRRAGRARRARRPHAREAALDAVAGGHVMRRSARSPAGSSSRPALIAIARLLRRAGGRPRSR